MKTITKNQNNVIECTCGTVIEYDKSDLVLKGVEKTDYYAISVVCPACGKVHTVKPAEFDSNALIGSARAKKSLDDYSPEELANAAHRADRIGLYACPHTGVALGGLEKLVAAGKIDKEEEVIVISTAHALKFTEFKVGYHEQKLEGIQSKFANPIFKAPAEIGAVMDILKKEMANRRR